MMEKSFKKLQKWPAKKGEGVWAKFGNPNTLPLTQ
jgi:hypothetical protein